jgi:glutamate synthase (NADPH/NADH) large chain
MARSQKPNEIGGVHADARNACAPLHDPSAERDACGVGFIANVRGIASHAIVEAGLTALERLEHRAATGAEEKHGRRRRRLDPAPRSTLPA